MSENIVDSRDGPGLDARTLLDRAAAADVRARRALPDAIDDLFLPDESRLDDRTRSALNGLLAALAGSIEREVRDHAGRLLTTRREGALAAILAAPAAPVIDRLASAGLLRDPDFIDECVARVRLELASTALPATAPDDPDSPSLLVRLARSTDRVVATAASAMLAAESRRAGLTEGIASAGTGLPADLNHRLLWWVAAALRDRHVGAAGDGLATLDRALAEAAIRSRAAHDETERLEVVAMRLADAIGAQADELPTLLVEALRDRQLPVFVALIANALGIDFELVREILLDPGGERLWLVLRALEVPRDAVAQIGYLLCEGDPRRDVEAFADMLEGVMSIDPQSARDAVGPLRLHPDYRAAVIALQVAVDGPGIPR